MYAVRCDDCRDTGYTRRGEECDCAEARDEAEQFAVLESIETSLFGEPTRVAGIDAIELDDAADDDCDAGDCARCGGSGGGFRPWHCIDCDGTGRVLREVRHAA